VRLKPAGRNDALRTKWSVLHGVICKKKHAAWHAEPTLEVFFVVDRRISIETTVLSQNSTQT